MRNIDGWNSFFIALGATTNDQRFPVVGSGKRNRRKMKRGKGGMQFSRYYYVPGNRWCCYGHDHIEPVRGSARAKEKREWRKDWL